MQDEDADERNASRCTPRANNAMSDVSMSWNEGGNLDRCVDGDVSESGKTGKTGKLEIGKNRKRQFFCSPV